MRVFARVGRTLLLIALVSIAVSTAPSAQERGGRLVMLGDSRNVADLQVLRGWDARVSAMLRGGGLRVRRVDGDDLVAGRQHERLDQVFQGVRVYGGEIVRQLDNGQTVSVFGRLYEGIAIDTEPVLTPVEAAAVVTRLTGVPLTAANEPQLVVLPRDEGDFVLAYQARVATDADIRVLFIDAKSGALAFSYSDLQTTVGTGTGVRGDTKKISTAERSGVYRAWDQLRPATIYTFDMKGDLNRTIAFLNNQVTLGESDMSADTDNVWEDAATVDGHVYAGLTYDYFFKRYNRQGLDGQNLRMATLVHPVRREDVYSQPPSVVNTYYLNAFYHGNGIMVYGEGLPVGMTSGGYHWTYFSGALDVVSHELTHGVTDFTSDLIYRNESGALNEAFSDIMGTSVEFFYQEAGAAYMKADYLIGEDLTSPMGGFRSMANPQAYGDPDHYSKRYLGTADNGGVHSNSGIANHAFYLAVEGGTNRTSGLSVQGVGSANRERIEKTFYRAFTTMLPASATFSMARAATIQAARDLYGAGSDAERAVTEAWTACGVQ